MDKASGQTYSERLAINASSIKCDRLGGSTGVEECDSCNATAATIWSVVELGNSDWSNS